MKKTLPLLFAANLLFPVLSSAQTVDVQYLNPKHTNANYDFLRLGNPSSYFGGLMLNHKVLDYGNGDDFTIFSYDNRDITVRPGTGNFIVFPSAGGKMGIGTTSPSANLEIKSNTQKNSELHINTTTAENVSLIRFQHANVNKWGFLSNYLTRTGNFSLYNYSNQSYALTINPSNQIGIGTTSLGSHKLAVEGSIGAREVKVEAGAWSDFVFEEGYDLPSLQEVENFVKANHHLPDVPSEKEVLENGIELGKMDAKLLQKIEELTLYVIQLNNTLQEQQITIETLQSENNQFKQEINRNKTENQ